MFRSLAAIAALALGALCTAAACAYEPTAADPTVIAYTMNSGAVGASSASSDTAPIPGVGLDVRDLMLTHPRSDKAGIGQLVAPYICEGCPSHSCSHGHCDPGVRSDPPTSAQRPRTLTT